MKYTYTARDQEGKIIHGDIDMPSEKELAEYLHNQNLVLTKTETDSAQSSKNGQVTGFVFKKVSVVDKIFFTQNLQVMIKAGLSMSQALHTLSEQANNKYFQYILNQVSSQVNKGVALSDALNTYPKIFPELFVNMIKAGEKSGRLEEVLFQLTDQLRKNHALISKVKSAMTYPIIVVIAMIGIGIAMIVFVIPQMTAVFQEANVTLPLPTRVLIAVSDFVVANGLLVTITLAVLIFAFVKTIKTKKGKHLWHSFLLKLPILKPILQKINLAKFSRTFCSLIKTEIPIVQAFQITASTVNNELYKKAILEAAEGIKKGLNISKILAEHKNLFSPLIIQMVAVGEETGTLDNILDQLASFYEEDVDRTMSSLSTIIEPVLMLLLGIGVGGLAISILLPMYSLSQSI